MTPEAGSRTRETFLGFSKDVNFGGDEDYAGQATLDLNVTFLNAATGDVVAEARILRSSRALVFTQVDVRLEDGTLVATGRATFSIIRKRS